jgi:hypothetical protein
MRGGLGLRHHHITPFVTHESVREREPDVDQVV